jgi:hypothetical protein
LLSSEGSSVERIRRSLRARHARHGHGQCRHLVGIVNVAAGIIGGKTDCGPDLSRSQESSSVSVAEAPRLGSGAAIEQGALCGDRAGSALMYGSLLRADRSIDRARPIMYSLRVDIDYLQDVYSRR